MNNLTEIGIMADRLASSAEPLNYRRIEEAALEVGCLPGTLLAKVDNIRKAKADAAKGGKR